MQLTRRNLLKAGILGGAAAFALPAERIARTGSVSDRLPTSKLPKPFTALFAPPPVLNPIRSDATTDYYELDIVPYNAQIAPGLLTPRWGYNGTTPGPTIYARRGREAVVRVCNMLPPKHPYLGYVPWTSTHLHGSASLPEYDGYADDLTMPGSYKDYRYPNFQDARTLWYHDHGVHHTADNVYMGMAGAYVMVDDREQSLPIPHGRYDVPLVIQDVMLRSSGRLLHEDNSHSGLYGDIVTVNGKPWPVMRVERRKYRFRILNGSVSRSYRFALSTGEPVTFIGTDGGLMPAPQQAASWRHAPAERYEIVIDFSKYKIGQRIVLKNLEPPNNVNYDTTKYAMAFDVVSEPTSLENNEVPSELNPDAPMMDLVESDAIKTRHFKFEREHGHWVIDGMIWQDVVDSGYTKVLADPELNTVELWEFDNPSGGWFHPIHVHLIDFKVLDRNGRPPFAYEKGPKDVVYLGENELVRVIARFGPQVGRYMIHCHNLPHEDHDMMGQFWVRGPDGNPGHDPVYADRPKPMPAPPI